MAVFAEVVDCGSMTAAGGRLGISASAVSQQLRQLERQLGMTLLHRSTRKLTLTEAGERFHSGCAEMLAAARAVERMRDAPEGELRLAAPAGLGLAVAVEPDVGAALAAGRVVPVLPRWRPEALPVHAVTPRRSEQPAKVRHAIEALRSLFSPQAAARRSEA